MSNEEEMSQFMRTNEIYGEVAKAVNGVSIFFFICVYFNLNIHSFFLLVLFSLVLLVLKLLLLVTLIFTI